MPDDAAFTLTEMAASLVVAAMLVSGLGEVTRQYARTIVRVRATLEEMPEMRLVQAEFAAIERAEPDGVSVAADAVAAEVGDERLRFELSFSSGDERRLSWETDGAGSLEVERFAPVDGQARFELGADGALRLWSAAGEPPLLVAVPKRTAPFDCRFDVVVRECR